MATDPLMRVSTAGTEARGKNYSDTPATAGLVLTSTGPDGIPAWDPVPAGPIGPTGPAGPAGPGGNTQVNYWFHDDPSTIATYSEILTSPANGTQNDDTVSVVLADGEKLIEAYVTDPGVPGTTKIPAGNWSFFVYRYASIGGVAQVVLRVYKRDVANVETLLFFVTTGNINEAVVTPQVINYAAPDISLAATDRLVVKVFGKTSVPFATLVHFVHDGTLHASWFSTPALGPIDALNAAYAANWAVTDWYIDNVTGSDSNNGTTAGTALQHCAELNRRLGPWAIWNQSVTVHILANGAVDPLVIRGELTTAGTKVTAIGTATTLSTFVLASFTQLNHNVGGVPNGPQITGTGVLAWTPNQRLRQTTGTHAGTTAWLLADLGAGQALTCLWATFPTSTHAADGLDPQVGETIAIETLSSAPAIDMQIACAWNAWPDAANYYNDRCASIVDLYTTRSLRANVEGQTGYSLWITGGYHNGTVEVPSGDAPGSRVSFSRALMAPRNPNSQEWYYCGVVGCDAPNQSSTRVELGGSMTLLNTIAHGVNLMTQAGTTYLSNVFLHAFPAYGVYVHFGSHLTLDTGLSGRSAAADSVGVSLSNGCRVSTSVGTTLNLSGAAGDVKLRSGAPLILTWAQMAAAADDFAQHGITPPLAGGTATVTVPYYDPVIQQVTATHADPSGTTGTLSVRQTSTTSFVISSSAGAADTSTVRWMMSPLGRSIQFAATPPPTILSFAIDPASISHTIQVLAFTATSDTAAWMISETPTAPTPADPSWTGLAPATYTVASAGAKKLYAWVKNSSGMVSSAAMATCTVIDPTIVTQYAAGHGWTIGGTGATGNLNDTAQHYAGTQSASLVSDGAGHQAYLEHVAAIPDMTGKHFAIAWYMPSFAHVLKQPGKIDLYAGCGGWGNYYVFNAGYSPDSAHQPWLEPGRWNYLSLPWNPALMTTSGAPTKATIDRMRVAFWDDSAGAMTVYAGELSIVPDATCYPNGCVSFTFDDGYAAQYTIGLPALRAAGYAATAYVIMDLVDTGGYVTLAQLQDEAANNWDISYHAFTLAHHAATFPALSDADLAADIAHGVAWLKANGFRGWRHGAFPQGMFTLGGATDVMTQIRESFKAFRTVVNWMPETVPPADPCKLRANVIGYPTTLAQAKALVDNAVTGKQWQILAFHNLVTTPGTGTEWAIADFQALVTYIKTTYPALDVLPVAKVLRLDY